MFRCSDVQEFINNSYLDSLIRLSVHNYYHFKWIKSSHVYEKKEFIRKKRNSRVPSHNGIPW